MSVCRHKLTDPKVKITDDYYQNQYDDYIFSEVIPRRRWVEVGNIINQIHYEDKGEPCERNDWHEPKTIFEKRVDNSLWVNLREFIRCFDIFCEECEKLNNRRIDHPLLSSPIKVPNKFHTYRHIGGDSQFTS